MASVSERVEKLKKILNWDKDTKIPVDKNIQDAMLRYEIEPTKEDVVARCDALIRELKDPEKAKRFNGIMGKVVRSAAVSAEDFARVAEQMRKIKKIIINN